MQDAALAFWKACICRANIPSAETSHALAPPTAGRLMTLGRSGDRKQAALHHGTAPCLGCGLSCWSRRRLLRGYRAPQPLLELLHALLLGLGALRTRDGAALLELGLPALPVRQQLRILHMHLQALSVSHLRPSAPGNGTPLLEPGLHALPVRQQLRILHSTCRRSQCLNRGPLRHEVARRCSNLACLHCHSVCIFTCTCQACIWHHQISSAQSGLMTSTMEATLQLRFVNT